MMIRPKHQRDFMHLCLLLVSAIWATVAVPLTAAAQDTVEPPNNTVWTTTLANPNPNNLDTPNIINALQHPHSDLVLLSAHRGIHALAGLSQASGVPENSLQSIGLAAQAGWEMLELDVKLTSDGVPILSHDKTWGRQWCGMGSIFLPGSASPYDPFTPPGSILNDPKNPTVTGTALSDTRSFLGNTVLRDSVSLLSSITNHGCNSTNQLFGEYPPTLSDALDYISKNKIRMVVMLDIQKLDIAQAALNVVLGKVDDAGRPFLNSVVFKMPLSVFPNGTRDFANTFGPNSTRVNFIPVINTADVAPQSVTITDTEDGGFDLTDVGNLGLGSESGILFQLQNFETDVLSEGGSTGLIRVLAVEVGYKEPGGILTTVLDNAKLNLETRLPMTVGEFNPVGEFYPNGDTSQTPQFFRSSNGTCCDTLDQYWYNNPKGTGPIDPSQPVDHSDQRTNLNFLIGQGFQYLITDDPTTAHNLLQQNNMRNLCHMQPSCEAGTAPDQGAGSAPDCQPSNPACQSAGTFGPTPTPPVLVVNSSPASNFDFAQWELQLPTGSPGSPTTISSSQLQAGFQNQFFFTNSSDGSLGMKDPGTNCVTTPNSAHCRTELREMNPDGSPASWSPNGTNKLDATLKVEDPGGSVVIGQVHLADNVSVRPVAELYYDSAGNITIGVEQTTAGGNQLLTFLGQIPVGTLFSYELNYSNNRLSVSINGGEPFVLNTFDVGGLPAYFKAGDYGQTTAPSDVHFFDLRITHTPKLNTSVPPGSNFDLSVWELQLPTGDPGHPTTISNSQLEGGYQSQYFFTSDPSGALGMKDPGTDCVTTPHSTHCRTELREVNKDGSQAFWLANGTNTLKATLAVVDPGGSVNIGQIHLADYISSKPLCQLFYDSNGNLDMGVEQTLAGGNEVRTHIGNIPVGTVFTYQISYSNNQLSVSLNNGAPINLSTFSIGHFPVYFKAGAYGQTTAPSDVHFFDLKIFHKDHTINKNGHPGDNFNFTHWELQLPTGTPGHVDTVSNSQLEGGYESTYFFTNSADGSLGMKDPGTNCVATSNSGHCRTELREVNADGTLAQWQPNGTNILHESLVVDNAGGSVNIGQIHLDESVSTKPLCQLFYDSSGNIEMGVEQTTAGGNEVRTFIGNVPVGTPFSYAITYSNNQLSVSINDGTPVFLNTFSVGGLPVYFKAGAYGQTTSPVDLHIFDVRITHQ